MTKIKEPLRILVIEGHDAWRYAIKIMIESIDKRHMVIEAPDQDTARNILATKTFDVVISDVEGYEEKSATLPTAEFLFIEHSKTVILFLTAKERQEWMLPQHHYFQKRSWDPLELQRAIKTVIDSAHMAQ